MNYKLHYDKLIDRAKNRSILKTEYTETHHIIPKSVGGNNTKENLVKLFPEEHIIAHLLLVKIYNYQPALVRAVHAMTNGFNQSKNKSNNNKKYGYLKRRYSEIMSNEMKSNHYLKNMNVDEREKFLDDNVRGKNNPNYGHNWSDKQKDNISKLNKGYFIAVDVHDNKFRIKKTDKRYISGELVAESRGRKVSDKIKKIKSAQNSGPGNPNSKEYIVYDENDNIVYCGKGGFVDFISAEGIPKCAVYKSIKEKTRLYHTKRQQTFAYKNGVEKFIGWRFERLS